jgi:ubiquinone/menaquinone biosynthesis C-methylase UbiE
MDASTSRAGERIAATGYRLGHQTLAAFSFVLLRGIHAALNQRAPQPSPAAVRELLRRFAELLARDLENAERGLYPRDLLWDFPIGHYLAQLPSALLDLPGFIWRSRAGRTKVEPPGDGALPFPRYYLQAFHWQPNGWFSDRSARFYDLEVEMLFGGMADVMRRMAIPPVKAALDGRPGARALDVCCGTGRFLAQLHAAAPHAHLYGVDLSPHCLDEARRQLSHVPGASLVGENAETLPFLDGEFAAVSCIFALHEMPRDARRRIVAEARRVLEPGGVLALLDADQVSGDGFAEFLRSFPELYHEPFFKGYQRDDLADLLAEQGFAVTHDQTCYVSRLVAGRKLPADQLSGTVSWNRA